MVAVTPLYNNFTAGEISPIVYGRTEQNFAIYRKGCETCLNWIPISQGPLTARPGTSFIYETKDSSKFSRLVNFQFSIEQAYIIEFGDQYIRFYRNKGIIESGPSTPYEIASPYLEADLRDIQYIQSADVLYITHPSYAPRKLSRTGHTSWTLTTITFLGGPYLPANTTATTITPSGTTGSITLTASAGLFSANDVGRVIRIKHSTTWGYARVTGYTSPTVVDATVVDAFGATTASTNWRLGLYYIGNYPSAVTFFGDRLWFGGTPSKPQRVDGSVTSDYENFAPSATDGTLADSDAVSFTLNASDVDYIRWLSDNRRGLLIGTSSSEWIVRSNSLGEAITYKNIFAERSSTGGSAKLPAIRANDTNIFIENGGEKVREISYNYEKDGYIAPDISLASEHLFRGGVLDWTFQRKPVPIIWMVRSDGVLIGMSYQPEQEVLAFHRHELGGSGIVESVASISSSTGSKYELWMTVRRVINGNTVRYVEVMNDVYNEAMEPEDAVYLDCSATYSGAPADVISGLDFLEGETVSVVTDGAVHPNVVVSSGQVTLNWEASKVHIGYNYNSDYKSLRAEGGAVAGTSQGLKKNIHKVMVRFHLTNGIKIGGAEDNIYPVSFREYGDTMGQADELYSGDIEHTIDTGYDTKGQVFIRRYQPFPATILAIAPRLKTSSSGAA